MYFYQKFVKNDPDRHIAHLQLRCFYKFFCYTSGIGKSNTENISDDIPSETINS